TGLVPSVINGGITALYFILWGKGLQSCGPLRVILAEYSGAVLGVLSAVLYGRRGHIWKKVGGLSAMLAAFYFLSQGWTMADGDLNAKLPFSVDPGTEVYTEEGLGIRNMLFPGLAGVLSALRRVITRRVSLKNQIKRRLHAITITSATCFLFPVAMWVMIIGSTDIKLPFSAWAFSSTILFGIILIIYVDNFAEERLHIVFSSPRHLMVAAGCIIIMEIVYKMDFALLGFLICAAILGIGIYEATSLDHVRKDSLQNSDLSSAVFEDQIQISPLPT
ncbi:zinc transporter 5, partial [Olea europaea subsp. europaea]